MSGLREALGCGRGDVVAIVGAGGKTTLAYALCAEAGAAGLRAIVTATTHMGEPPPGAGPLVRWDGGGGRPALAEALAAHGCASVSGPPASGRRLAGLQPASIPGLLELADLVVVQADGARGRPFKLPAAHEPALPDGATLAVVCVGLDALGAPLDEDHVHRLPEVLAACGLQRGERLDETALAAALAHPAGYLGRFAPDVRTALVLNRAEGEALAAAERLALVLSGAFGRVLAGSARLGQVRRLA